jgi:galactose mutarotase-like enzyme
MTGQGVVALEKENVLIRAGDCVITLLPHLGGKIASIRLAGRELLQAPLAPLAPRTRSLPFDASDASGWDECLPSVAACTVLTSEGPAQVPDHGDLWRVEWSVVRSEPALTLRGVCFSLPLALERTLALTETANGAQLRLDYTITNTGSHPAPWSWAAHSLFAIDPGDEIELPPSIHALRLEGSGGNRLGQAGDAIAWPVATLSNGSETDLRIAQPPASAIGDKLFAGPLAKDENWCVLHRHAAGLRIRVRFDSARTPYLGLWICYGGWPDRPGPKQNCVAIEPATAPVDSLAQSGSWSRTLSPSQSYSWPMFVDFEMN